jgi:hypothetical protein
MRPDDEQGVYLPDVAVGDPCPWGCVTTMVNVTHREAIPDTRMTIHFDAPTCPGCGWYWDDERVTDYDSPEAMVAAVEVIESELAAIYRDDN